jgi:hypothetical protein
VIPKPAYEKTFIVTDTSIKSERIDGPANIRDTVESGMDFPILIRRCGEFFKNGNHTILM